MLLWIVAAFLMLCCCCQTSCMNVSSFICNYLLTLPWNSWVIAVCDSCSSTGGNLYILFNSEWKGIFLKQFGKSPLWGMLLLIWEVEQGSDVCVCGRTLLKWMQKAQKNSWLFLHNAVKSRDLILAEFEQVQKMET